MIAIQMVKIMGMYRWTCLKPNSGLQEENGF